MAKSTVDSIMDAWEQVSRLDAKGQNKIYERLAKKFGVAKDGTDKPERKKKREQKRDENGAL